ncbi:MAG: cation-translocating P-type ATPase, partial [Planctomycetaceae bacterium]|nr:cation-translocating P-type ATPase [Planctomycetaceae bacterium]
MSCPNCKTKPKSGTPLSLSGYGEKLEPYLIALSGLSLAASFLHLLPSESAWIAIIVSGTPIFRHAAQSLANGKLSVDVLIATGIIASIAANFALQNGHHSHGYLFAAGEIAFIMAIGHYLEERTVAKARSGIESLITLTPQTARRIQSEHEDIIPASEVCSGDVLRVLPGETVPVDGEILTGTTSLDQSVLTGESMPVDKTAGETVFGGTVNRFGSFTMRATHVGEDSSFARMIRLIKEAEERKSPMERLADRWASALIPAALFTAAAVAAISYYVFAASGEEALKRGITILVVFCPCSLVLATPTAVIAAIGNASRRGILIRSGEVLEQLGKINTVCFDKTGTLTYGKPQLSGIHCLGGNALPEVLSLAASAEKQSEHPLAACIVEAAMEQSLPILQADDFELIPGQGISVTINNRRILAGNNRLLERFNVMPDTEAMQIAETSFMRGETVIFVAEGGERARVLGIFTLADSVRETAKEVVRRLHQSGVETVLLTGDNERAAEHIGMLTGVKRIEANLLPADKTERIKLLQQSAKRTAMVGDGLNDAAAMKTADAGIAMGRIGSDLTINAADAVLVRDNIEQLPFLLQLSAKTHRVIIGNIILSMSINILAVCFAASGLLGPVLGALIHNAGSCSVVLNASRLIYVK